MKTEGARKVQVFNGLSHARVHLHIIRRFLYTQTLAYLHFIHTPADVTKELYKRALGFLSIREFLISFKLLQGFQIKRLLVMASRLSR